MKFIQGLIVLLFTIAFFGMMWIEDIPFYTIKGKEYYHKFTTMQHWLVASVPMLNTVALYKREIRFLVNRTPFGKILTQRFGAPDSTQNCNSKSNNTNAGNKND